jgi:hypothetical protein
MMMALPWKSFARMSAGGKQEQRSIKIYLFLVTIPWLTVTFIGSMKVGDKKILDSLISNLGWAWGMLLAPLFLLPILFPSSAPNGTQRFSYPFWTCTIPALVILYGSNNVIWSINMNLWQQQ